MWFKNLRVYQFTQSFTMPADAETLLNERAFTACSRSEPVSLGWTPVLGDEDGTLSHQVGNYILLCARKEEKVIPASAVKEEIEHRKEAYQQEHARPMPRKEQQALKEDIQHRMLPQALSKFSVTWGFLDIDKQRLFVDASSSTKAEEFNALLRSCLGSLPVKPWGPEQDGSHQFTEWLKNGNAPAPFELGQEAELRSLKDDSAVVRFKNHELSGEEIESHLSHNKIVTQIALEWDEHLSFVMTDDYAVKRLKFSDIVKEQLDELHMETRAEQLDSSFALMSAELSELMNQLETILVAEKA